MGRILRQYYYGQLSQDMYRALVYGLSQYLSAFRMEKEETLEQRIDQLEKTLGTQKRFQNG
jgi:hypothetical protein